MTYPAEPLVQIQYYFTKMFLIHVPSSIIAHLVSLCRTSKATRALLNDIIRTAGPNLKLFHRNVLRDALYQNCSDCAAKWTEIRINIALYVNDISLTTYKSIMSSCARIQVGDLGPWDPLVLTCVMFISVIRRCT